MIRNNFATLLAERNLKATEVADKTGIARSTLSRISNNSTAKIEYSTINALCHVLKVTPNEFFSYNPYDCRLDDFKLIESDNYKSGKVKTNLNFYMYGEKYISIVYEGTYERIIDGSPDIQILKIHLSPKENESTTIYDDIDIGFQVILKNDIERTIEGNIFKSGNYASLTVELDMQLRNKPWL